MIFHVFVIDDTSELQSDMFLPGGGCHQAGKLLLFSLLAVEGPI